MINTGGTSKKKCLLIDDDPDDQDIFKIALSRTQLEVECTAAGSGHEALQMLRNDPGFIPDYIFLDLNMPGMDGKHTLLELKKLAHLNNAQVIIYSTSSYVEDIKETKKLGASNFITKPTLIKDLVTILTATLK